MTTEPLGIGTRVRVRRDPQHGPGPWPDEPMGTISEFVENGAPFKRVVAVHGGSKLYYYVIFDQPQRDADGDGPYSASEVLARYVEPVPKL